MSDWGRLLARWLAVDAADFDRVRFLWGRTPAGWPLAAAAAVLALYLWLSWRAARGIEHRAGRAVSLALRAAAALILAAVAFDPSLEFLKTKRREQSFAVLVDASQSMGLRTRAGESRAALVDRHLADHAATFDALEQRYAVRYYTLAGEAAPATRPDLAQRQNAGRRSALGESIDDVVRAMAADPPAGILLYSDGADHGRVRAALAGDGALAAAPVFPVLLPAETPPDAAVAAVAADPYAFVRNGFDVRARIEARGLKLAAVDVTLKIDGQVAATQSVALPPEGGAVEAVFRTTPQRVGRFVYTLEIPNYPGEAVTENNRRNVVVKVVRDRVRVLQVVGEPSWDERFLRRYLEKDPNVDLISFMILRTREDLDSTPESELSLIPFPTKELFTDELKTFDLVIFQNFDYRPYFEIFPGRLLDNLRRFVEQDGGGLLMIGGDKSFTAGGYAGTPLADILPVELTAAPEADLGDVRPVLTADGARHPVTGLDLPPAETELAWRELPPLAGVNLVGPTKPGATALLRHPTRQTGAVGMPVLAVMEAGKGRTMALTGDASWRWSFGAAARGGTGAAYQRFWNNAVRWLVHDPDFGRVKIETDRDAYEPGETLRARCRVFDENYKPAAAAEVALTYRLREGEAAPKRLAVQELEPGVFAAELEPAAGGVYELACTAKVGGRPAGDDATLVAFDAVGEELKDTSVDNALLRALAERSGGRVIAYDDGDWGELVGLGEEAAFEVVGRRVARLWDNALLLTLVAGLLSLEWFLRRRWGGL